MSTLDINSMRELAVIAKSGGITRASTLAGIRA